MWGWVPLSLLGGCICAGLLLFDSGARAERGVELAFLCVALVLFWCGAQLRGSAAAALSGDLPCAALGAPRCRREALHALGLARVQNKEAAELLPRVAAVGSGLGYWLRREAASGPTLYTHRLTGLATEEYGLDPTRYVVFYAGTTIHEATRTMAADGGPGENGRASWWTSRRRERATARATGRTFWSHPSIGTTSLGAWFACSGHGNAAEAGGASSRGLCFAEIVDAQEKVAIRLCDYALDPASSSEPWLRVERNASVYRAIRRRLDAPGERGRYVVIALGFRKGTASTLADASRSGNTLAPNVLVNKELCVIDLDMPHEQALQRCKQWLNHSAVLRVLFIGRAAPSVGIGIRWVEFDAATAKWPRHRRLASCFLREEDHVDEHDCSRLCRATQADTCRIVGGCREGSESAWAGVSTLRDANLFSPLHLPPLAALTVPLLFYNFEVVCRPKGGSIKPEKLYGTLNALRVWHSEGRWPTQSGFGRSELRCSSTEGRVAWIDFAVNSHSFERAFDIVLQCLEPTRIALHSGKYTSRELGRAYERAKARHKTAPPLDTVYDALFADEPDVETILFAGLRCNASMERM